MISITSQNRINVYKTSGAFLCLAFWEIFAQILNKPLIAPTILEILTSVVGLLERKQSYLFIGASLSRVFVTLFVDFVIAFFLGLTAGLNKKIEDLLSVTENIFRSLPTVAVLLISLIWFKSNITPIFVTSLIVLPILYRNITDGVKNIDKNLMEMAEDFGVPFLRKLFFLYIPSIKPFLQNALALSCGFAIKVTVTAEVLSQPKNGIGTALYLAKVQLETAELFAWAGISIFIAMFLQKLFRLKIKEEKPPELNKSEFEKPNFESVSVHIKKENFSENEKEQDTFRSKKNEPIKLVDASFSYENFPVFEKINMQIPSERLVWLTGKSGCGKTTLLEIIAGKLKLTGGGLHNAPDQRSISIAYQDIRLIPHLTTSQNIEFVLPKTMTTKEKKEKAAYFLELTGLKDFKSFLPSQLSGGMKKRVGLARALAFPGKTLLLDEAFDSIDEESKNLIFDLFFEFISKENRNAICVTHNTEFVKNH